MQNIDTYRGSASWKAKTSTPGVCTIEMNNDNCYCLTAKVSSNTIKNGAINYSEITYVYQFADHMIGDCYARCADKCFLLINRHAYLSTVTKRYAFNPGGGSITIQPSGLSCL